MSIKVMGLPNLFSYTRTSVSRRSAFTVPPIICSSRLIYDVGVPDGLRDDEYMQVLQDSVNLAIAEVDPEKNAANKDIHMYLVVEGMIEPHGSHPHVAEGCHHE